MRVVALAAVIVALGARLARAQQVRGIVTDSAAAVPISGAVVTGLDSSGTLAGRTISGANGRFTLALTHRAARLRVIRIGYAPRELVLGPVSSDGAVRVSMQRLPAILTTVRVTDRELCPGSTERGAAFQLWEDARAGLLATVVTREAKPADATLVLFERTVAPNGGLVAHMRIEAKTGRTTRPFISPEPAAALAEHGYMREAQDRSRDFGAPDADVILDESFAAVHCFHLQQADANHPGQIGLAFVPVPGRDTLVDVTGVIWMDAAAPALRSFDFRYTGLEPAAAAAGAGGHIEFRFMPNGVSFIERWVLRLPVLSRPRANALRSAYDPLVERATRRTDQTTARVTAIVESGGQILSAEWADGIAFRAPRTAIAGRLTAGGRPASGAVVSLRGTDYRGTANAKGEFVLEPVIAGTYTLVATDTSLVTFVAERQRTMTVVATRDSVVRYNADFPPLGQVVQQLCHGQDMPVGTSIILGQILDERGAADPTVHLRATWQANYNEGGPVSPTRNLRIDRSAQDVDLDDEGRFAVCGVVQRRPVHLTASRGVAHTDTIVRVPYDSATMLLRWYPHVAASAPHK